MQMIMVSVIIREDEIEDFIFFFKCLTCSALNGYDMRRTLSIKDCSYGSLQEYLEGL